MPSLYGIPNCDTIKKARKWLSEHGVEYEFYDYKKHGIDEETLRVWIKQVGWETLLNRRGTTWRKVPDDIKNQIDESSAIELMLATPSIIKRPVLVIDDNISVGFKPDTYAELLT